jgi:hypothetical protein
MNGQYPLALTRPSEPIGDKNTITSLTLKRAVCAGLQHGRSGQRTEEPGSYASGKDGGAEVAEGSRDRRVEA